MTIEYLGAKIFLQEVEASGEIWVARGVHRNIYSLELNASGISLPVWSSSARVADFLKNARLIGSSYAPDAVPLIVFTEAWLSDQQMAVSELQINPDGKSSRVLIMTAAEFRTNQTSS